MGIDQSSKLVYSVPISGRQKDCSEIRRNPKSVQSLELYKEYQFSTMQDVFLNSVRLYKANKFLGTRDPITKIYKFKTYQQIQELAQYVGSAILHLNLATEINEYKNYKLKFIAIMSKNREEWLIVDIANMLYGNTMVPLLDTIGKDNISQILDQTNVTTLFCSATNYQILLNQNDEIQLGKLKNIICFDFLSDQQILLAQSRNIKVYQWNEILVIGQKNEFQFAKIQPEQILTLSYTAGSTGQQYKGVMQTHQNFVANLFVIENNSYLQLMAQHEVHLSYLPLAHVYEKIVSYKIIQIGGQICYYSGNISQLKYDLIDVKPTMFISVPRLFNRFYEQLISHFQNLNGIQKIIADTAIASKLDRLNTISTYTHPIWDPLIFHYTKKIFGGRIRFMVTGSAPISKTVLDFLKIAVCCPIIEGYGQTESTGSSFLTNDNDPTSGHVGGPTVSIEFKIQDVPNMNYYSNDEDFEGYPMPRGEICLRGPVVCLGYYKDEEHTNQILDEEGWLHTGDIGLLRRDGSLKIIDRKKNIFKLAQGEYISPEKVENIYKKFEGVQEVFLYGDSLKSYCVAIIVPKLKYIEEIANEIIQNEEEKDENYFQTLCQNQQIINSFFSKLSKFAMQFKLLQYEQAKKIYLTPISMLDHGVLSPTTFILQRHIAKLKFKPILQKLYDDGSIFQ